MFFLCLDDIKNVLGELYLNAMNETLLGKQKFSFSYKPNM